jgi:hypothetical protein
MKTLPAWLISIHGYSFASTDNKPEILEMVCKILEKDPRFIGGKYFSLVFSRQSNQIQKTFMDSMINTLGIMFGLGKWCMLSASVCLISAPEFVQNSIFFAGKNLLFHRRKIGDGMKKLLLTPRGLHDFQLIAIADEVFDVTDNDLVLLNEDSPTMVEFAKKHGEIKGMVLMESLIAADKKESTTTYINASTPTGKDFLQFLGKQILLFPSVLYIIPQSPHYYICVFKFFKTMLFPGNLTQVVSEDHTIEPPGVTMKNGKEMELRATNLITAYLLQILAMGGCSPFTISDADSVNSLMDSEFPGIPSTSGKPTPAIGLGTIAYVQTLAMASPFYSVDVRMLPAVLNNFNSEQLSNLKENFDEISESTAFRQDLRALLIRWCEIKAPDAGPTRATKKLKLSTPKK